MPKIFQYLSIATFFSLSLFACEDTLDLEPLNSATPEIFYSDPANFTTGLFGIYDALQDNGFYGGNVVLDGLSDNAVATDFLDDVLNFAQGNQVNATGSFRDFYLAPYELIQRSNLLLDNIDVVTGLASDERALIKAEARALRAMAYMRLVYLFGDVPLITTSLTREEALSISRNDRNEVISFVLQEFQEASSDLGNTSNGGRLTRQAVLALRARVMLYEARLNNQTWGDALTAINLSIMEADEGGHQLIDNDDPSTDYLSLFLLENEENNEYIFSVAVSPLDSDSRSDFEEFFSWQAGALLMYVHQNLADAYDYADGSAYNPSDTTFLGRDPRLSVNIMHPGQSFAGETYGVDDSFIKFNGGGTETGLYIYKFSSTDHVETLNERELNMPVIRYAELLLMQAEALTETDGNPYPPLNAVRDRAGLPELSGLSQEELRNEIIQERRVELAFEGLRWFDLMTLGIAEEVINGIEETNIIRAFTTGRSELLPIPQTEIGLNPNLAQNPGY